MGIRSLRLEADSILYCPTLIYKIIIKTVYQLNQFFTMENYGNKVVVNSKLIMTQPKLTSREHDPLIINSGNGDGDEYYSNLVLLKL